MSLTDQHIYQNLQIDLKEMDSVWRTVTNCGGHNLNSGFSLDGAPPSESEKVEFNEHPLNS